MQKIQLTISQKEVMESVALHTSYVGLKDGAGIQFFDRVATISNDEKILDGFWTEACGELAETFRPFLTSCSKENQNLVCNLEVSGSYDNALTPTFLDDAFKSLVFGVLGRWFMVACPEKAQDCLATSRQLQERAFSKLCQRTKPRRNHN